MKIKGRGKYIIEWVCDFADCKKGDQQRYSELCDVNYYIRTGFARRVK